MFNSFRVHPWVLGLTLLAIVSGRAANAPTKPSPSPTIEDLLIPGAEWQFAIHACTGSRALAAGPKGEFFYVDNSNPQRLMVVEGVKYFGIPTGPKEASAAWGQAYGPDGRYYTVAMRQFRYGVGSNGISTVTEQRIPSNESLMAYNPAGQRTVIVSNFLGAHIVVAHNGNMYVTQPPADWNSNDPSIVWLVNYKGAKRSVDNGLKRAGGLALSPDQTKLYVAECGSEWVYRYVIKPDGTLGIRQPFAKLPTERGRGPLGVCVDRAGRLYVASANGVQVFDAGSQLIGAIPDGGIRDVKGPADVCLAGENLDTLFVSGGDKIYKRKLNVQGVRPWEPPIKTSAGL